MSERPGACVAVAVAPGRGSARDGSLDGVLAPWIDPATVRRRGPTGAAVGGILRPDVDPLEPAVASALSGDERAVRGLRWAVVVTSAARAADPVAGPVAAGGVEAALDLLTTAPTARDGLIVRRGDREADELLAALAPLLMELLDDLTPRQRLLARLLLVDGLRQAEVAERLGVARATISVMTERGRIRSIRRLLGAIRRLTGVGGPWADAA